MSYARITGTGGYLPEKILTNGDLEKMVDTSDEWIRDRTGIRQRHIAADDEFTVDLAEQLTEMIETQRNYQANSKTFQTASELMDVLVNLKR